MNRTLKETLTKLAIETGGDWVTLFPFTLFWAHNTPYKLNLTPFEILYGRPPPVCPILEGKCQPPPTLGQFQQTLMALSKVHNLCLEIDSRDTQGSKKGGHPLTYISPGEWVWVKRHQSKVLKPGWKGVRECLTGGFLRAVSHESFVPLQAEQHAAPRD